MIVNMKVIYTPYHWFLSIHMFIYSDTPQAELAQKTAKFNYTDIFWMYKSLALIG